MSMLNSTNLAIGSCFHAVSRLWRDKRAVSAIEFALIAPMMVTLYLGAAETSLGVSINRKVSRVASTVSDLVTQAQTINAADLDGIMNASFAVMQPTNAAPLRIAISGVQIDNNNQPIVIWSRTKGAGATKPPVGSKYKLPAAITVPNSFIVVANVQYDYEPAMGGNITGSIKFTKENYLRPRIGNNVACSDC